MLHIAGWQTCADNDIIIPSQRAPHMTSSVRILTAWRTWLKRILNEPSEKLFPLWNLTKKKTQQEEKARLKQFLKSQGTHVSRDKRPDFRAEWTWYCSSKSLRRVKNDHSLTAFYMIMYVCMNRKGITTGGVIVDRMIYKTYTRIQHGWPS